MKLSNISNNPKREIKCNLENIRNNHFLKKVMNNLPKKESA